MLFARLRRLLQPLARTPFHPQWLALRGQAATRAAVLRAAKGRVIDVGCGDRWLAEAVGRQADYIGLDYPLTVAQGYPGTADVFGDAAHLPFSSAAADTLLLLDVLEHLRTPEAALAEAARVLKPGGRLVLGVPVFLPPLHLVRKHVLPALFRLVPVRDLGTHHQAFSLYSFAAEVRRQLPHLNLMQVRGFRIISGGLLAPLENYRWWWRLNRRIGELMPAACIEIQAIFEKP